MVDAALAQQDVSTAQRAWREAHAAALRTRAWRPLVEVGDAVIRIGRVDGYRPAYAAQAREAYMAALVRARAGRSVEGVLRVAESFAALGDHHLVDQCLAIAEGLGANADHEVIVRLRHRGLDVRATPRFEP
jgi:5-carboxymethyl-2-hydroxymuconate isomerase